MSKRIPLSRGKFTLVSDEDFERVNQFKWSCDGNGYAVRNVSYYDEQGKRHRYKVILHRFILDCPDGQQVDHINHNKLDNRRRNLRVATQYQNHCNSRPLPNSTSKYKGVSWHRRDEGWTATIRVRGRKRFLGTYKSEEYAAKVYDAHAFAAWGEFAYLNLSNLRSFYSLSLARSRALKGTR